MSADKSHNLALRVSDHARMAPDRIAFERPGRDPMSYRAFDDLVRDIASALVGQGVVRGDRVVASVGKSVDAIALFLAVIRVGAIYVPINPQFTATEASVIVEDAEPSLLVHDAEAAIGDAPVATVRLDEIARGDAPREDGRAETDPDRIAVMLFTSGTTGRPKGAPLSHRALSANLGALVDVWRLTENDTLLHALPIFHTHGLFVAAGTVLHAGGTIRLLPAFDAETVCREMPGASVFMGVPAMYTKLLACDGFDVDAARDIRLMTSGSSPMALDTFEQVHGRTGCEIVERYGMTETGILTSNPVDGVRKIGSVGLPLRDVTVRIVDDDDRPCDVDEIGRVLVRTPCIGDGYWRRPDAPDYARADGFFDTGDLGYLDGDGYLYISGRAKDLIISGGFNIYPREIENVLCDLDDVADAAVIGVPHRDFGEGVVAVVEAPEDNPALRDRIDAAVRENLTNYKRPKAVVVVPALPRNAMGKPVKSDLRASYAALFKG